MAEYKLGRVESKLELKCAWNDSHALVVKYISNDALVHTQAEI